MIPFSTRVPSKNFKGGGPCLLGAQERKRMITSSWLKYVCPFTAAEKQEVVRKIENDRRMERDKCSIENPVYREHIVHDVGDAQENRKKNALPLFGKKPCRTHAHMHTLNIYTLKKKGGVDDGLPTQFEEGEACS